MKDFYLEDILELTSFAPSGEIHKDGFAVDGNRQPLDPCKYSRKTAEMVEIIESSLIDQNELILCLLEEIVVNPRKVSCNNTVTV